MTEGSLMMPSPFPHPISLVYSAKQMDKDLPYLQSLLSRARPVLNQISSFECASPWHQHIRYSIFWYCGLGVAKQG